MPKPPIGEILYLKPTAHGDGAVLFARSDWRGHVVKVWPPVGQPLKLQVKPRGKGAVIYARKKWIGQKVKVEVVG